MIKNYFILLTLCFSIISNAQVFDVVIAADGSGDYTSIQTAIDRLRSSSDRPLLFVKAGTYQEKINIGKDNVSLIGDKNGEVLITWGDYASTETGLSTSATYTVQIDADGFYAENITFENSYTARQGQAVAVSSLGSEVVFKNCRFIGFQDTYYARKGMSYHLNCYIEGGTDFIFGEATAVFDTCEIKCLAGGQYITAPADTKLVTQVGDQSFYHGTLFRGSSILAGEGVSGNSYYLGRPWQPNSSTVYVDCTLGKHIRPEGWSEWSNTNHLSAHFHEYGSIDEFGSPVDISGRVSWSSQLTAEQVKNNYNLDYFLTGWDPVSATFTLAAPLNLLQLAATSTSVDLQWDEVSDAIGYVVSRNALVYAYVTETGFTDEDAATGDEYVIQAISSFGGMGRESAMLVAELFDHLSNLEGDFYTLNNETIIFSKRLDVTVLSISGKILYRKRAVMEIDLRDFDSKVLIIHALDETGQRHVIKFTNY
ncbi:MAG: pectinesterase family protein [Cyclobacteriaceae bacterium]